MRSTKQTLFAGFALLCFLILLTSPSAHAFDSTNGLSWKNPFDFWRQRQSEKPVKAESPEKSETDVVKFGQLPTKGDASKTMTAPLTKQSEESVFDRPIVFQKPTIVPVEELTEEDTQGGRMYDDGMSMEDAVVMPAMGFGEGIMPEAVKSSGMSEPLKTGLPLKSSPAAEMPVAQDSDTTQAMPQLFAKEVMSGPMPPAEQESMEEEPSFPMKEADDVSPVKSSWFESGILDKEESVQKETERVAEAEPQMGDMPTTGRDFLGGMTAGSIQHAIEEQTETEEPAVKEGIEEEEQSKTDEEKAKETDLSYKALFDATYIKEDIARDITEQTAGESKSEEHQETELAESVKGSGGTQERTLVPFIPGTVVIPTGQKSVGSVQKPIDEPPSPSTVADEPPSSPSTVADEPPSSPSTVADEPPSSPSTVADEPPSSPRVVPLESSTGAEEEEKDDVVAEETTVSTTTSDVEEKKEEDAAKTEEPTASPAISDVEEKKEEGAVGAEETTESTEISDEVEKKEEIDTKDHPALSERVSRVSSEKDPVVEVSSPSPDAIPSETPIESPPTESTPVLSQEPPQEPETKQEPAADPEKAEDVKAVELPLPEQSPAHPDEEKQVQEEDQASSSSTTEEAPVEARAAEPQAPAIQQVSTMASLKEILGSALANATNVKMDVETEEGKVAILIEEGGEVELERLELEPLEGVDILVKVAAGGELRLNDVSIRDRPQRRLRKALNGQASIKTGLLVDGGSVLSIRDSTFESATDTMIKVTQGSHLSCSGCVFRNNAGDRGGALLVQDSTLYLRSCKMTENVASSGGAIHFDGGGSAGDFDASARIEDTVFSGNEARGSGAGVYMSSARAINVVDSKFQHGSASNGGAVYIRDVHTVQIDRSLFSDNRADVSGGGFVAKSIQTLSVLKSTFKNNEALGLFAGAGLISDCSNATFRSTNFVENHAVGGGALAYISPSVQTNKIYLQDIQFEENNAKERGGALLIQRDSESQETVASTESSRPLLTSVNHTSFFSNSAQQGGAVFVSSQVVANFDVKISVSRSNFTQNKAHDKGGGVFCGQHSTVVLSYSSFEHNEASEGMNCAEHCGCQVKYAHSRATLIFFCSGNVKQPTVTSV